MSAESATFEVIDRMAQTLNLIFHRADQDLDRPSATFVVCKLLSDDNDMEPLAVTHNETADPAELERDERYNGALLASLSVLGRDEDDVWNQVRHVRKWFRGPAGQEVMEQNCLTLQSMTAAQNRTTYLDTEYEYRIGFDLRLTYVESMIETVPALDVEGTINAL